ncbi:MAG: ABC transporter permease [Anaerolineales bacterium]|jgi:ABC-2 type transport system permease protein
MTTFWAMVRKEFTIMLRYPVEFVASFGQVFLIVAIFTLAGLTFSTSQEGMGGSGTSGLVVYGFVLFMFISDTLWSLGYRVRHEQVQGTLEQLYLSPASKFANLVSRSTTVLLWTGLLSVAAGALMTTMLGRLPFENPLLGLYLLVMSLSGTFGVGFAFAALTLRIKETAQTMANLLQFSFLILCANFFPFAALPTALRMVSRLIPLAYAVDAFRSTLMGYPPGFPELAPIQVEIVIVSAFGVLMPLLGYYLYRRAEIQARRSGSLAEY